MTISVRLQLEWNFTHKRCSHRQETGRCLALLFLLIDIVEDPESRLSHSDAEGLGNLGKGSVSELSREHTKHKHFRKKRRRLNVHVWQLSAHFSSHRTTQF